MEKRILLSFALSFGVLLIYQFLFTAPGVEPTEGVGETAVAVVEPVQPVEPSVVPRPGSAVEPEIAGPASAIAATLSRTVTVENAALSVVVSNQGAVIESVRLRDYAGAADETLELLDADVAAAVGWPLELITGDTVVDDWLKTGLWVVDAGDTEVSLELAGDGLQASKTLRLDDAGYYFTFDAEVTQDGRPLGFRVVWQGSFGDQETEYTPAEVNVVYMEGGAFDRINVGSIEDPQPVPVTSFLGIEDQYFMAMMMGSATTEQPVVRSLPYQLAQEDDTIFVPRIEVPYDGALDIYVGPKQKQYLEALNPVLVTVIDLGWFEFIARPLLAVLLWIYGYVGNFGWAIILMTLLINVALFPLRLKQQLSMLKMQKIQPQMRTLQDKYKKLKANDPRKQEVQSEMMGIYKKNGVNPLGGCFPLLLQMPIFFAIFQLLRTAIELRGAPWVLWVQDLSVQDPYYVLPVLMGVSMMATQRLTPTVMDPAQARMMMMMPLLFLAFMLWQQSGLVLYWLTSNLAGVGQQLLINRFWAPKQKKEPRPAIIEVTATEVDAPAIADSGSSSDGAIEPRKRKRRNKR